MSKKFPAKKLFKLAKVISDFYNNCRKNFLKLRSDFNGID